MCRSAQKGAHLKMLIAEIRAAVAKRKGKPAATPSEAKPLGAVYVIFRKALRLRT